MASVTYRGVKQRYDLARAHDRHVSSLRQGRKSRSKAPGRCLVLEVGREVRLHHQITVGTLLVTRARVCACWSLASNSSRAVRKVKQTRVIFPFSSTSTSHLLSQTNSRDHNRWAINNGCCGGRLFWLWAHHRADAATQLVHEFEQRVEDGIAAGFACTTTCWR